LWQKRIIPKIHNETVCGSLTKVVAPQPGAEGAEHRKPGAEAPGALK
jgi:hypothetical protein